MGCEALGAQEAIDDLAEGRSFILERPVTTGVVLVVVGVDYLVDTRSTAPADEF